LGVSVNQYEKPSSLAITLLTTRLTLALNGLKLQHSTMGDASSNHAPVSGVQRHPETGIAAVIVGAGVGGIMTALECWRKGIQVRIFERSLKPETEGETDTYSLIPLVFPPLLAYSY
jgi:hypothetical protein